MYPTYMLEVWLHGQWNEIGWRASTPRSSRDLTDHGAKLAASAPDQRYRIVALSPFIDGEPTVVHEFTAEAVR
jgi:hypothetical protein